MTRLWQADLVLKLASSLKIFRKEYWILPLLSQYPNWVIFFSNEQRTFTNHLLFFQKNWIPRNAMIMSSGIFLSEVPVLFYNLWYNGLVPESVLSQIRASELKHRQRKRAQRMSRYVQEWREKFITCTHTRTHMYNYPFMKNLLSYILQSNSNKTAIVLEYFQNQWLYFSHKLPQNYNLVFIKWPSA